MSRAAQKYSSLAEATAFSGNALGEILDVATSDEPKPTPSAAALVQENVNAGPVLPSASMPTVAGGGGPDGELYDPGSPPGPTPRQSAENLIELAFTLVPAGDWQPENDTEREELIGAVERVFTVRGWSLNLPPEAILIAVAGKYTRRRMQKPAVAKKLGPWLARVPLIGKLVGAAEETPEPPGPFATLPKMTPEQE